MTQGLTAPFEELVKDSNTDLISDTENNGNSSKSVNARDNFTSRNKCDDTMINCKKETSTSNDVNLYGKNKNNLTYQEDSSLVNNSGKLDLKSRKISEKLLR